MTAACIPTEALPAVIDAIQAIHFSLDRKGIFARCGGNGLTAANLRPEDLLGRSAFSAFADAPDALAACHRALAGEHAAGIVVLAGRTFRLWLTPARDTDGDAGGAHGIALDATAELHAEQSHPLRALDLPGSGFRDLLESMPDAIVISDGTGQIALVNRRTEVLFGYNRSEIEGQPVEVLLPERYRNRYAEHRAAYTTPHTLPMGAGLALFGRRKDGSEFPVEISLSPLHPGDAQLIIAVVRDSSGHRRAEAALRQSEEHFRSAFVHAAIGMALVGLDGHWLRVNRALCTFLGYTEATLLITDFQELTHPDDLALDLQHVAALVAGTIEDYQMEKRYRHRDGRYIWALLSVSLVRDDAGTPVHFISQIQDIDGRKRAEEALRAGEARFRELHASAERQTQELRLLGEVQTALARELDLATVFRVVVEGIATTFGYTQVSIYLREGEEHVLQHQIGYDHVLARVPVTAGVSGRAVREGRALLIGDVAADPAFLGAIGGLTSEICVPLYDAGRPAGFLNVESSGGVRLNDADLRLMEALGVQVGIAIERARLHGALREREERLAHLALHDPLTGLPNRRGLGEALAAALARQRRGGPAVALLYIDLDDFKAVNDALGHEAGDYLLGEVADRLRASIRAGDTPGRLGGDEFAVLVEGSGVTDAQVIAARIVAALAAPMRIGTVTTTISASVGVAPATAGETADDLLRRADAALYTAKRSGKNQSHLAVG
jgi:diguanylate cyclase (GGDEF)-like protein/PAS domain S-box-containing protein